MNKASRTTPIYRTLLTPSLHGAQEPEACVLTVRVAADRGDGPDPLPDDLLDPEDALWPRR